MYKITYIHKDSNTENILFDPWDTDTEKYTLTDATLSLGCGLSGELTLGIPESNPAKNDLVCLTDEVIFYRNGEEIWRGRPVTWQEDFDLTGTLTCEGILSYLYDSYFPPFEFAGSPKELLEDIIASHNAQVEEQKRFTLGEVTVVDANEYISRSSTEYNRSLEVLMDKLTESSLGGYLRVRIEGGVRYLDYLETYGTTATQPIQLGVNLIDIADTIEYGDLITALLPLGARDEDTQEYLTVASVNGGSIYIYDEQAVSQYGWICGSAVWEDVTLPENLLKKAQDYLTQVTAGVRSMTIHAIDLTLAGEDVDAINLGDSVLVQSAPHGVNQYIELVEMTLHPLDPASDTLTLGAMSASYTGTASTSQRKVQDSIDQTSTYIRNLSAEFVTTEYLAANYATFGYVDAEIINAGFITVDYLEANYASIEYLETNYATIDDLEATVANITILTSDVANIMTLLGGEAGIGELETIHLTTDNAIIDEAVIAEALIGTVLADIINSNIIYTDYITIRSLDGSYINTGSMEQFSDANGTVRIQIGLDASGEYNFYIADADGNLLWDALGLTEAGLTANGAIIKDAAIADDANIAASKLDIEDLTRTLNENGQLVLTAEQITIGGGTLSYVLTNMQTEISSLEAMGIESIENWYATSSSPDSYPPFEEDPDESAVLGEGILGLMILGETGDFQWTTDQPDYEEGKYVWLVQKITYVDGTVLWTEPTLLTDDYMRTVLSVQQTALTVIEGEIQAKVWMSDIKESEDGLTTMITDQYGELTVLVDTVDARVGQLTTIVDESYEMLLSEVTSLTLDIGSITGRVSEVEEKANNALVDGVAYYAVSTNPDYYPPHDATDITAVLGEGILGQMVLGVSETNWTTDQPTAEEGEYVWICYLRTRADGSTYWTDPTLLSDAYLHERYSELLMTIDSISMTVSGGLGSTASIVMRVGDTATSADIDLSAVRESFANDDSSIVISAGLVAFEADTFMCDSEYFSVAPDGTISATSGTIGGWTIGRIKIYGGVEEEGTTCVMQMPTEGTQVVFGAGGYSNSNYSDCLFRVLKNGQVYSGNIMIYSDRGLSDAGYLSVQSTLFGSVVRFGISVNNNMGIWDGVSDTWIVYRSYDGYNHLGSGDNPTMITGSSVEIYGNITSNITINPGDSSQAALLVENGLCSCMLSASDAGNCGLYDSSHNAWLVRRDSSGAEYLGQSDYSTTLIGSSISVSGTIISSISINPGDSSEISLSVGNSLYTCMLLVSAAGNNGIYDSTHGAWIARRDSGGDAYLGQGGFDTYVAGSTVYLSSAVNALSTLTTSGRVTINTSDSYGIYYTCSGSSGTGANITILQSWSGQRISLGIGTGGVNRGIYDNVTSNSWIIYMSEDSDNNNNVYIPHPLYVTHTIYAQSNMDVSSRLRLYGLASEYTTSSAANVNYNPDNSNIRQVVSSSSIRYKNIDIEMDYCDIESLFSIPVYWFTYKSDYLSEEDERYMKPLPGFIAEDWEDMMPVAVDHNEDGSVEKWNPQFVTPVMFEMIKYNHSSITSVEDRLDSLQDEVARLAEENAALKQQLAAIKAA